MWGAHSLYQHRASIRGSFSCNYELDSSGYGLSMLSDMRASRTPHKTMECNLLMFFLFVVGRNPNTPDWSPMADDTLHRAVLEFFLCQNTCTKMLFCFNRLKMRNMDKTKSMNQKLSFSCTTTRVISYCFGHAGAQLQAGHGSVVYEPLAQLVVNV